jgi:hypothetical protein
VSKFSGGPGVPDSGQTRVFHAEKKRIPKTKTRWRRGWDSNPRATSAAAGFQDRCLQPLGHPSVLARRSIHNVSGGGIVRKVPLSGAIGSTLRTASRGLAPDINVRAPDLQWQVFTASGVQGAPVRSVRILRPRLHRGTQEVRGGRRQVSEQLGSCAAEAHVVFDNPVVIVGPIEEKLVRRPAGA